MRRAIPAVLGAIVIAVFSGPTHNSIDSDGMKLAGELSIDPNARGKRTRTCKGIKINPGNNIQRILDRNGARRFCFAPGKYRLRNPLIPKSGQELIGIRGAVLSGSRILTGFKSDGNQWFIDGQTQQNPEVVGKCESGYDGCRFAEQVFLDNRPLWQVTSLGELSSGEFFFDYGADRIYIADDPSGHTVEASIARAAVIATSHSKNVKVKGFAVEKFSNEAGRGAVHIFAPGSIIKNTEVRLAHGAGVVAGTRVRLIGNYIHHNGNLGVAGSGSNIVVKHNEISFNNTAGFNWWSWQGGGAKWTHTRDLVVSQNHSHHNTGPGLWTDTNNVDTLYEKNIVIGNAGPGIFHETSYDAVVRRNTTRRNGFGVHWSGSGGGIELTSSSNVTITRNEVIRNHHGITLQQADRGSGDRGPFEIRNVNIHHNKIVMDRGHTGMVQFVGDTTYFTGRRNRFQHNTYLLGPDKDTYFVWMDKEITKKEWRGFGQDTEGVFEGP